MRDVVFSLADVDLFDQDISPSDYEFFKKHTGTFKRMLEDQSKEKKKEFVDKFKTFALTNGCMKGCPSKNDNRHYLDEAVAQYNDNFVNGKFSTAKSIIMDAVILAQNRHNLQYMGANSYSKDPFFHKETRDTFRRLFGQPSEKGTCLKVVCVLPLHIKFGGSICRYLRRWLDAADEPTRPQLSHVASTKNSTDKTPKGTAKSAKKKEKEDKKKTKSVQELMKEAELEEFNYQFRKLLDCHPRNYDFDELIRQGMNSPFKNQDKSLSTSKTPNTKSEVDDPAEDVKGMEVQEISQDEGLSLSEYLGLSRSKVETSSSAKTVDDTSDSPAGLNSCSLPLKITLNIKKEPKEEKEVLIGPHCPSEDGDDADETDKTPLSYDFDYDYEEVKKTLLLDKPHPNVEFEQLSFEKGLSKENIMKLKKCKEYLKETREPCKSEFEKKKQLNGDHVPTTETDLAEKVSKRHACASCRQVEPAPKKFKKCQRCHGKRTRFYCSRKCQEEDWIDRHRDDHNSIEDVT